MVEDLSGYVQLKSEWIMRTEEGFHKYAFHHSPSAQTNDVIYSL